MGTWKDSTSARARLVKANSTCFCRFRTMCLHALGLWLTERWILGNFRTFGVSAKPEKGWISQILGVGGGLRGPSPSLVPLGMRLKSLTVFPHP